MSRASSIDWLLCFRVQGFLVRYAPGHTDGHAVLLHPESGTVVGGDHVVGFGSVSLDPVCGDMSDYFATTHALIGMQPRLVIPAHGPPSYRPISMLRQYLAHRQAREEKILDSYQRGNVTADAIVRDVYTDVAQSMWPFAVRNVELHLSKLHKDGRIPSFGEAQ